MKDREKYGITKSPLRGTRVLSHPMEHFQEKGIDAHCLIVIDDEAGTFTAANVYNTGDGFKLGRGYDPAAYSHPLPADGDEKWKTWRRRGYEPTNQTFGGVVVLKAAKPEVAKV